MGIFLKHSRAANSTVCGRIVPNLKLVQDIIVVLLTCMNEEDPIKIEGARIDFSDTQGQLTPKSVVEFRQNLISSKLLWLSLLPAKMKKIRSKIKALDC